MLRNHMLSIGKINTLIVKDISPIGCTLEAAPSNIPALSSEANNPWTQGKSGLSTAEIDDVQAILPISELSTSQQKQAPQVGDKIDVYLYYSGHQDAKNQVLASVTPALINFGEFKSLKVKGISSAGAFFDWGLSRDLYAPKQHIHSALSEGLDAVVRLVHEPKQKRLYATSKIEQFLNSAPSSWDYKKSVELLVYAKTPLGFKVIIDQRYAGLLYQSDLFKTLRIGEIHSGFISKIRDDGKIDCALQRHDKMQRQSLTQEILDDLAAHGGLSSLTDKSDPQDIQTRFNVSKGAYKKALGQLYKSKKIVITRDFVKLL
ncbi:S1 RNA-binding domain-containing protein [Ningiella sp. W23]|uniref:CvfB family protein n=1 Tax=Ningiella sp. W23 TaxID=3023715 RepID=UPI0037574AE4